MDAKGLGPKEFTGKEGFFNSGRRIRKHLLVWWSAEQTTEITTTAIDREFLPIATDQERGVQNQEFVLQQMHTALMALTSYEANDIVANSRKNPLNSPGELSSHDHVSSKVLSVGTPSRDRMMGVLRFSLREEDEG